ncbi:hypothetical protein SNOG_12659 [Parastagonospora nodorum SN15]|uniref:Uncharacterized protein n=1 Tax=Phaeosphaeria nodorum (strain SN15 / ATCC MYA-4574 / FGSC 10173) TaxID=321614 RepID=Q0U6F5_PHANO|nr:hypothetical protein SNOG_12659 [Parastagonospora nodorum SN15]EAT79957.2 hypothetical protein SNOG_12659 [Parastagonospora nodorum SN15]
MSEYGNVVYRLGDEDSWEIYKETIEEWKVEKGFLWTHLTFIALDPTSSDQFIAIRKDGTWAGSIDDINEDALESFALNFFARAKTKHKAKPSASQPNGFSSNNALSNSADGKPDAATQALYEKWSKETATMFAAASVAIGGSKPKTPRKIQPVVQFKLATGITFDLVIARKASQYISLHPQRFDSLCIAIVHRPKVGFG